MYRLADIRHETRNFWVLDCGPRGFEVYQKGCTASTRVASIGHGASPRLGLAGAVAECERRQTIADAAHDAAAARHVRTTTE